ncbi:MAG: HEPN domain-containing protein [Synergistaceae bacterium]|nr:HEPN domain-containing protein [Synergistaceae bacterium]
MDTRGGLALSKYRFERAEETLKAAKSNFDNNFFNESVTRSYYAIFYGMLAVTSKDGFEASKHSSVISYFRKNYIGTKIFDKKLSDIIGQSFDLRTDADYEAFYTVSPNEAQIQMDSAKIFWDTVRPYLEACWREMEEKINERNF